MENLFVYALLSSVGIEFENEYNNLLDEMFTSNPSDKILLDLEFISSNIQESSRYIRTHLNFDDFDSDLFRQSLMKRLKNYYIKTEIKVFAKKMYLLWQNLPDNIQNEQPFFTLCYADDPLSWGDEAQTREHYEYMFEYYK